MVQFDNQSRKIKLKIVYYGPALGGKTTSLEYIHRIIDPDHRTKLYSLNTASDRTLFFDLMTLDLGSIRGFTLTVQLFTVPGQVQYDTTRRAVLAGVDAIVFVADSQQSQLEANRQSWHNLEDNLAANSIDGRSIPTVFQFNKQDLGPLTPPDQLNAAINLRGAPSFLTTATTGAGVSESFTTITELAIGSVAERLGLRTDSKALERLQARVRTTLQPFEAATADAAVKPLPTPEPRVEVTTDVSSDLPLSAQELMQEAVHANLKMADLNCDLDATENRLKIKVEALESIATFSRDLSSLKDPRKILLSLLTSAVDHLRAHTGAVLLYSGGSLRKFRCLGLDADPLMARILPEGATLADRLSLGKNPELIVVDPENSTANAIEQTVENAGFVSALALPLVEQNQVHGLVTLYRGPSGLPFDREDLALAATMTTHTCAAYANAVNVSKTQKLNTTLEDQVRQRTQELEASLDRIRALNDELTEKHAALELAYAELENMDHLKNELLARISHELRTPVSSLLTAATILSDDEDQPPPDVGARFAKVIKAESEKLAEVIDEVIQASVLASDSQRPMQKTAEVSEIIQAALEPLTETAAMRNIDIRLSIPPDLGPLPCDPESLASAVRAVTKNAVIFNREGGSVEIEVVGGDNLIISVKDTGAGIPTEDLPYVFDAFWQGGDLMTGKPAGIGLGLTIAQRIVEIHGGTLSITSSTGAGAEVVLCLPT